MMAKIDNFYFILLFESSAWFCDRHRTRSSGGHGHGCPGPREADKDGDGMMFGVGQ